MPGPDPTLARALFDPSSVALVGASPDERKYSSFPQRFLTRHGYAGTIYPINPGRDEVLGLRAYPTVQAIGRPVDHAFIMLPTALVEGALADCAAAGTRCVTILSNGFAESGPDGRVAQDRLLAIARPAGLRIIGPNSMGMVNLQAGIALCCNESLTLPELRAGRTALVSQSGSLLGAILSRGHARGMGFSKLVSIGNEADIDVGSLVTMLVEDDGTDVILLVLEAIRQPHAFIAALRSAHVRGKPVIALRIGGSAVGRELAQSHTGALVGSGAALDAFLRDCGVARVEQFETLIEAPALFAGRRPGTGGKRVTAVTTTGGGGALVIDALAARGVDAVPPDDASVRTLADKGIAISRSPLIDLTLTGTNPETYGGVLDALRASPANDLVLAVVGNSSQFRPDRAVAPIVDAYRRDRTRPIAAFLTPAADASLGLLRDGGVAAFRTPESCADAIRALLEWRAPRAAVAAQIPEAARAVVLRAQEATLAPDEARALVQALGIATPAHRLLGADPARWSEADLATIPFPVAAKIASRDIQHKTEAGGVVLGIGTPAALAQAGRQILAAAHRHKPDARLDGITVEAMVNGRVQALIGFTRDPSVGPTVTLAAGGVLAELYRDSAIRTAPIDVATAHEMIAEVRGLAVITGYRNLPRGDVGSLARALVAMGSLALLDGRAMISEAEVNPLIVLDEGNGVIAVDALVVRSVA